MKRKENAETAQAASVRGGLAVWLLNRLRERLHGRDREQPRLALLERITLAQRHSLALVEAEGRRFLVATSQEGGPAFYALDREARPALRRSSRVSW
jgi:Flagellar biosynthesis protein, FliO